MSEPIFSVSGLRGVVGVKALSPELVSRVVKAFLRFCGLGRYAIGRDSRPSGRALRETVKAVLEQNRCQVIDLGVCPTPTVVRFVRTGEDFRGGMVITASHNPIDWNGLKLVHRDGRFLFAEEVAAVIQMMDGEGSVTHSGTKEPLAGVEELSRAWYQHIAGIRQHYLFSSLNCNGMRFGVDAVNGAMSEPACELLRAFGAEPVAVNCEPNELDRGFPRGPEPLPENLSVLCRLVKEQGLDGGFAFDPDGDRCSVVDENGVPLGEEATVVLAALYFLPAVNSDLVVNLSTSRAVDDIAQQFGVKVFRTKVGEANVVRKMLETKAVLGGEGNGGVIFSEINLTRDGLVAVAAVLGLLRRTGNRLGAIRQSLPGYKMVKVVVPVMRFDPERLLFSLNRVFGGQFELDRTEGVRIAGADWWVHIRQSNTEPVVRIVAEAPSQDTAAEVINKVRLVIQGDN